MAFIGQDEASKWANDLRQLANLVERHPNLNWDLRTMQNIIVGDLTQLTEAIKEIGGKWDKHEYGETFTMRLELDESLIYIDIDLARDQVCKRVETEEMETYTEIDREAYKELPRVTKQRPKVIWECPPSILALANKDTE